MFYQELDKVCGNYVWILKWVNLHRNWFDLIRVLNFSKQWVTDYRCVFRTLSNIQGGVFNKKVNGFCPLTIFEKHSVLDGWQGSEYASRLLELLCCGSKRDTWEGWYMPNWFPYSGVIHGSAAFKLIKG